MAKEASSTVRTLYFVLLLSIALILVIHIFNIYPLNVDKFTFFIVSLFFVALILPAVKFVKFFDVIHVGRDVKLLKKK